MIAFLLNNYKKGFASRCVCGCVHRTLTFSCVHFLSMSRLNLSLIYHMMAMSSSSAPASAAYIPPALAELGHPPMLIPCMTSFSGQRPRPPLAPPNRHIRLPPYPAIVSSPPSISLTSMEHPSRAPSCRPFQKK